MDDGSFLEPTQVVGPPETRTELPASRLHHNALPVGTVLGEFEIVDLVGEGGFGIVYLAQDHSLHRKVALKEYMPALLAMRGQDASVSVRSERNRATFDIGLRSFVNEARMLAQFDHPALVKVYRFWEANGTAYMVMPFFSGKTLQDVLKERAEPPDEAWIRKILWPVMEALEIIHGDQVYHRDIAPDNIMLLADDRPVLLDFGAARRVITDMTQALTVILKPGYAPIEQYADMPGMKQGPWTDVYALAAVVYFMILRRKPPPAVSRLMQDSFEPLMLSEAASRYSQQLLFGIDQCLSVRSENRPQSVAAMRRLLESPAPAPTMPAVVAAVAVDFAFDEEPTVLGEAAAGPATAADVGTVALGPASSAPTAPAPATSAPTASTPTAVEARVPTVAPAPAPVSAPASASVPAAARAPSPAPASTDISLDLEPPRLRDSQVAIFSDVVAPEPARRGKAPLVAGAVAAVVALVAGAAYVATRPAPVATPTSVAVVPPVARPASAAIVAPPVPRYATMATALEAAVAGSDASLVPVLDVPASVPIGGELKVSVQSKADGQVQVFAWDEAADRVYRLAPDAGSAIQAGASLAFTHKDALARAALKEPFAGWRVVALLSDRPRDVAGTAFAREGELAVADRVGLEGRLAADGLAGLIGKPQCAASEPCAERRGVAVATVARVEPPAPARRAPTAKPAPTKAPGNEREYMKRLNQDLDKMLGK